jgi:serine/threonine protein kinase
MGRYHVLRKIGSGGMGAVYEAYDPKLARKVAIKVLHTEVIRSWPASAGIRSRARLVREAKNLAKLSHRNIVSIYDFGLLDGDSVFVAMEYVHGKTVRELLNGKFWAWPEAVELILQAAQGLAAAHAAELLHRDFKPENLIVASDGTLKILDFGLSKNTQSEPRTPGESDENGLVDQGNGSLRTTASSTYVGNDDISRAGKLVGTLGYMAPEQLRCRDVDPRTDLFALCCVAYELLTGKQPFPIQPISLRLQAIERKALRWPNSTPKWLAELVTRGLSADANARGTSISAWSQELQRGLRAHHRRGRIKTWMLIASLPLCLVVAWQQESSKHSDPECGNPEVQADRVWNDGTRETLKAAFSATSLDISALLAERASVALDDWRTTWTESASLLCPASRREKGLPELDFALREQGRACLHESRVEVEALLSTWRTPSRQQILETNSAVQSLSRPNNCAVREHLLTRRQLPGDLRKRAFVLEQKAKIRAASMLVNLADYETATQALASVQTTYQGRLDLDLHSDWIFERGTLDFLAKQFAFSSNNAAEQALLWVIAADKSDLAGQALQRLWFLRVYSGGLIHESDERIRALEASVLRAGQTNKLARLLWRIRAIWSGMRNDYFTSRRHLLRALHHDQLDSGTETLSASRILSDLAATARYLGDLDAAEFYYRRAEKIRQKLFPPGHPDRLRTTGKLSDILDLQNRLTQSTQILAEGWEECIRAQVAEKTCAALESHLHARTISRGDFNAAIAIGMHILEIEGRMQGRAGAESSYVEQDIATILLERGELASAMAFAELGLGKLRIERNVHAGEVSAALAQFLQVLFENEKFAQMGPYLAELETKLALANERNAAAKIAFHVQRGHYQLAQGKFAAAAADFEEVIGLDVDNGSGLSLRAGHHLALSEALLGSGDLALAKYHADVAWDLHQRVEGILPHLDFAYHELRSRIAFSQHRLGDALTDLELARLAFDPVQVQTNRLAPLFFTEAKVWWELDRTPSGRAHARALARRALNEYGDWDGGAGSEIRAVQAWLRSH